MGSIKTEPPTALGDEVYVNIIDKLRECGIADQVSLPQLVVVGDQSSGKSSVLESVTGFAFPRAPGLCTRYATQITSRRDATEGIEVSIIPRPDSSDSREERLRGFKRSLAIGDLALADVFADANKMMGIRGSETDPVSTELTTFSEDILKIVISGPTQQHLTVIDVPGIFRTATENLTTDDDILLVRNMVQKYIKDQRTIILAVIPCNVDIATQEVLTMAKEVDPDGVRTMGVLTKPDLAPEKAMQQAIFDLVQGRRNPLRLGYYVVKNRGADDTDKSNKAARLKAESAFFSASPWSNLQSTQKVGVGALLAALRDLLRSITKKEFKNVAAEVEKYLEDKQAQLDKLGPARSDASSQRRCLGQISTEFQHITQRAREGLYNGVELLSKRKELKLVTNIIKLNERFNEVLCIKGHSRKFQDHDEEPSSFSMKSCDSLKYFQTSFKELRGILKENKGETLKTETNTLMSHIAHAYDYSRGPELGTFGGSVLADVFRDQSMNWEPLALRHTSQAIRIVHYFITELLKEVCPDEDMRDQLMNMVLRQKLCASYKRAMKHTQFLLDIERNGPPCTLNHYFNSNLQKSRAERLGASLKVHAQAVTMKDGSGRLAFHPEQLDTVMTHKSNAQQVQEDIHDILKSYYKVARKRFVDVVCQQAIFYYLLDAKDGPLRIFTPDLVMELDDQQLNAVAGEDLLTRSKRDQLVRDIEVLEKASDELQFGTG